MDEDTTTPVAVDEGGNQPQPEPTPAPEAASIAPAVPENQPSDTPSEPVAPAPADAEQEQLNQFAQSKGLELDSANAIKAAKMAMNAEKLMHQKSQKASELEKNLSTKSDDYAEAIAEDRNITDPVVLELLKGQQRLQVRDSVRDFWNQDGIDRSLEPQMIQILNDRPHLAGDLDALYAVAERTSGREAVNKNQGGQAALKKLAATQQAAVPTGNATNRAAAPQQKKFEELSIAEMEAKLGFHRR